MARVLGRRRVFTPLRVRFALFDVAAAAVTALAARRPVDGGTRACAARARLRLVPAACLFGDAVEASVCDDGAAVCERRGRRPRRRVARLFLNGETSALRRTASGVPFTYYRRAATATRRAPPKSGSRRRCRSAAGSGWHRRDGARPGFVDRGGVYCRFGRSAEGKRVRRPRYCALRRRRRRSPRRPRRLRRRRRRRWCRRRCGRRRSSCAARRWPPTRGLYSSADAQR